MKSDFHIPVLLNEAINGLNIKSNGIYVDSTLGRAGHSSEILKKLDNNGLLIGIDQDDEALEYSKAKLSKIRSNFKVVKSNFRNILEVLEDLGIKEVDGILFDLGVSSPQFDEDYRGFSYNKNSELDMRMDLSNPLTAKIVINTYPLEKLTKIFREYGEEKFAYQIAKNIVKARENGVISTTFELVEIIKSSKPQKELSKPGHPAKQVFQALRIEVNDELNALKEALEASLKAIRVGGRIVVITFQSLEDRIVKQTFKSVSVIEGDRRNDYINPKDIKTPDFKEINRKVIIASEEELERNRRSKSAKLRILEKVKYYYFKKAGICFSIFVGAFVAVAIPISIAAGMRSSVVESNKDTNADKDSTKVEGKLHSLLAF